MYHFTNFAIQLNYNPESLKHNLPSTDCRQRPDQLALENGQIDLATSEKLRIEEKQREARRMLQEPYKASYFEEQVEPISGETMYVMVNDYWEAKQNKFSQN